MICIVGEGASGKSTLQRLFVENNPSYQKIVTYTTRPPREGEKDGDDYNFISEDEFKQKINNGFFTEVSEYKGWYYGIALKDVSKENAVAVLTPAGMRTIKRFGIDVLSVYLFVDRRIRLINSLKRGDDIEEAYRRNLSDYGQFDGVFNEVDYVIDNSDFKMDEKETLKCLEKIIMAAKGERNE